MTAEYQQQQRDIKAGLELAIYAVMPEITDDQLTQLVKKIMEICHVEK